jgi:hypothetical protein
VAYRATSSGVSATWSLQTSYITGSLIVDNTITGDKIVANSIVANKIDTRGLSIKDANGNIILAAGTALSTANISGLGTLATQNSVSTSNITGLGTLATQNSVSYASVTGTKPPTNADNTGSNIAAGISGQGNFATLNQITSSNVSTYIANLAVGTAQINNLAVSSAKIADLAVNTLQIAGNAVTIPVGVTAATAPWSVPAYQFQPMVTASINSTGAPRLVQFFCHRMYGNYSDPFRYYIALTRTTPSGSTSQVSYASDYDDGTSVILYLDPAGAAGIYTYEAKVQISYQSGYQISMFNGLSYTTDHIITILEVKK